MKKKKWIIWLGAIIGVLLVLYFVAGYFFGNLPVASALLGTNKPRDLGVDITVEAAVQGLKSLHKPVSLNDLEAISADPGSYTTAEVSLDGAEASSLISLGDLPDSPFRLVQVDFDDGGRLKTSGVIDVQILLDTLRDAGAGGEMLDRVMGIIKNADYFNFYMEGTCSITDNRLFVDLDQVQIGRIGLPVDLIEDNASSITDYIEDTLLESGYNIRSMVISEDKVTFDMDRPISSITPWIKFIENR